MSNKNGNNNGKCGQNRSRGAKDGKNRICGNSGKMSKWLGYAVTGIATGMANGLFGSGGGTVAVPAMVHLLGVDEHKAHATAISVILPLAAASSIFYISKGHADWGLTLKTTLGGMLGGYIGARLLDICPEKLLRRVFAVFMAAAGIRMIFSK